MLILRQDMVILGCFKVWTWDNIVMFCAQKRNGILTSYSHIQWSTWLKQQRDDDFHDVQKNIESHMSFSHCLIDLWGYYQLYYNRMACFPWYFHGTPVTQRPPTTSSWLRLPWWTSCEVHPKRILRQKTQQRESGQTKQNRGICLRRNVADRQNKDWSNQSDLIGLLRDHPQRQRVQGPGWLISCPKKRCCHWRTWG